MFCAFQKKTPPSLASHVEIIKAHAHKVTHETSSQRLDKLKYQLLNLCSKKSNFIANHANFEAFVFST